MVGGRKPQLSERRNRVRIKEDDSSWHASGIIRRDFRQDKSGPEVIGAKKRTNKNWCKKQKGRKHTWVQQRIHFIAYPENVPGTGSHPLDYWLFVFQCSVCTRERTEKKFRGSPS